MNEETKEPHNLNAEEGLIASCCLADKANGYDTISHLVEPSDFYFQRNEVLYTSVANIAGRGEDINEVSLMEDLKKSSSLDAVGGVAGMMAVMSRVDNPMSIKYFAKIVKEKSQLRMIIRKCRISEEEARAEIKDSDSIRAELEGDMILIDGEDRTTTDLRTSVDILRDDYSKMLTGEYISEVVKTEIPHLDDKLGNGGVAPGEVMVIAAPTSCGKSQLALNIALRAAMNAGVSSAIVSLEMPQKQVTQRLVQCLSQVNVNLIRDRVVSKKQMASVNDALDTIGGLSIKSIHSVKSVQDMASQVRTLVRTDNIKMLIIDYLQLMPFGNGRMSKNDAIADVSHKIKQLALELNIPVLLLCQVGREGAKREGGLKLHDLKDSGDIENDADVVLLMWPKEGDVDASRKVDNYGPYVEMQYNVAKNREGDRDVKGIFKFRNTIGRFY
jgi:replicative DNA helicase